MRRITQYEIEGPDIPIRSTSRWFVQHDGAVLAFAEGVCASFDVEQAALCWAVPLPGRPAHTPRPREMELALRCAPRVYPGLNLVVHLCQGEEGALCAAAKRLDDGEETWTTEIRPPAPAPWTEPAWLDERLHTEELHALLACLPDRIVIAVIRRSRYAAVWTGDGRHFPRPPQGSGVHLYELASDTGRVLHQDLIESGWISYASQVGFDGLLKRELSICDYDWRSGSLRTLLTLPEEPANFICAGDTAITAYKRRRRPCVVLFSRSSGAVLAESVLEANPSQIRSLVVHSLPEGALLQVNETRLVRLNTDATPRYEVRVRPFVYAVGGGGAGEALLVGTDGAGTNFYAFDDNTGTLIRHEPRPGSPLLLRLGEGWLTACNERIIACVSRDGERWTRYYAAAPPIWADGVVGERVWWLPNKPGERSARLSLRLFQLMPSAQ